MARARWSSSPSRARAWDQPTSQRARAFALRRARPALDDPEVAGYRLYPRSQADVLELSPAPTSTPTATPVPDANVNAAAHANAHRDADADANGDGEPHANGDAVTDRDSPLPSPAPTLALEAIAAARAQPVGSVVRVRGVITVSPGWILGKSTLAIQDETAGIYVRLPQTSPDMVPGRVMEVIGPLADPYGNLEVRPAAAGITLFGEDVVPEPRPMSAADLGESMEGLLGRVEGTITAIAASSTGSLTVTIEDETGDARVFAHAPLGATRDVFDTGQRIVAIGLVGDRLGSFRLWPRSVGDITVVEAVPTPTPTRSPSPTPSATPPPTPRPTPTPIRTATPTVRPSPTSTRAPGLTIAEALRRQGQDVTIEGSVTTPKGLLDADSLRVTVQDQTGAVLVRLPTDFGIGVGQRIRITGEMGTYYGAPQVSADEATRVGDGAGNALTVSSAPIGAALEWRLVSISGTVLSVHRDGDAWRAELEMRGGSIPIAGLARAGIDSTALVEGRTATVTGIVKRAYPTATDQRFSVVPRAAADIRLGSASETPAGSDDPQATAGPDGSSASSDPVSSPASPNASTGVATAIGDVAGSEGTIVVIGGRVTEINGSKLTVDDGSGTAIIELAGAAASRAAEFRVGDLINVTGLAARDDSGQLLVVVSEPADVSRLTGAGDAATGQSSAAAGERNEATGLASGLDPDAAQPSSAATGLVALSLIALSLGLLAVVVLVSPRHRRRLVERVSQRVSALKSG